MRLRARATLVALLAVLAAPGHAALFWERVPLPPEVIDFNAYRLASGDGFLYVGGSRVSGGFFIYDVELVSTFTDRCYVLDFGKLIAAGPTAATLADPHVRAAYFGTTPEAS